MRKSVKVFFMLVFLAVLSAGCSRTAGPSGRGARSDELLMTVPSDAAMVGVFSRCSDLLEAALDSSDALCRCVPPRLRHSKAVLSWTYNGTLVPLLSVTAPSDTSSAVVAMCDSAASLGLHARYLDSGSAPLGKGVVLVSRSENLLESSLRHIYSGHSVFDARGFREAVRCVGSGEDFFAWSNVAAGKWIRKDCLSGIFSRSGVVSFMKDLSEWIVVSGEDVRLYRDGSGKYYADFLDAISASGSLLGEILPSSSDFALDLSTGDPKAFREAFRRHLDCRAKLSAYESELSSYKKKYGADPEKWAEDYSFREVALARWEGREVILLRPGKRPRASELVENRLPGYSGLVFGSAFVLPDESAFAVCGKWMVVGSEEDVAAFVSVPEDERGVALPDGKSRFLVYDLKDGVASTLSEKKGNIKLNVYKPEI